MREQSSAAPRVGAPERLRAAFWRLLEKRPLASITVRDLVREAGVNKNAFYYHYANLDDLARDAVEESLPREAMMNVLSRFMGRRAAGWSNDSSDAQGGVNTPFPGMVSPVASSADIGTDMAAGLDLARYRTQVKHLSLAMGPHGSPALQSLLRASALDAWCCVMGLDPATLGPQSRLAVAFFIGGIMGMLSDERVELLGPNGELPFANPFIRRLIKVLPPVLLDTLAADHDEARAASPTYNV